MLLKKARSNVAIKFKNGKFDKVDKVKNESITITVTVNSQV
ncbi:hypothetical protein [Clostridium perfringens]|nr:hypothetical protein [Clostridium perfringens]